MYFGKYLVGVVASVCVISFVFAVHESLDTIPVVHQKSGHTFSLPAHAKALESNPNIYYLGIQIDPSTKLEVEGYAILHGKGMDVKPGSGIGNGAKKSPGGSTCYGYIANGAKWKGTPEPRVVNGTNTQSLAPHDIFTIVQGAIDKREDASDGSMDGNGMDIFGNGTETAAPLPAGGPLNGANEVVFGSIDEPGVIAVTTVWGIFGGSPRNRYLAERDQVYDQVDFDRTIGGSPTSMDVENIVTHEIGHSFGMGDLYDSGCAEETMYGYASEGETKARTLHQGDIIGISKLY